MLKKLNVNRGCLQFSPSVLAGLTENMAETTKVLIESLRTQILDIYEYVSIDVRFSYSFLAMIFELS